MIQTAFSFGIKENFSTYDYIVTQANKTAFSYIQAWPNWPAHMMGKICIICGPANSGKSYLANLWTRKSCATYLDINDDSSLNNINSNIIIEDIENFLPRYEKNLLHLINIVTANNFFALFTTTDYYISTNLADLSSRLKAANLVYIDQPDDEMLSALLYKQLLDRQLKFTNDIVSYIIVRIERNFTAVKNIVEKIDKYSLETKKHITISFIKEYII